MPQLQRDQEVPRMCVTVHELLSVLATGVCLEVLAALRDGELDVSTLTKALAHDISTVSRSLGRLQHHGLVRVRSHKKRRLYRLSDHMNISAVHSRVQLATTAEGGGSVLLDLPATETRIHVSAPQRRRHDDPNWIARD